MDAPDGSRPKDLRGYGRLPHRVARDDTLTPETRLMYGHLDAHKNKRTGRCDPSIGRLAAVSGCSRRWVIVMLQALETAGHIRVVRREGYRNEYELLADDTGEAQFTGEAHFTREAQFTPTRELQLTGGGEAQFTGQEDLHIGIEQKQEEQNVAAHKPIPPPNAPAGEDSRQPTLFDQDFFETIRDAVAYFLGGDPQSPAAGLLPWFPDAVAQFFLAQSWHRKSDARLAHYWAQRLAAIGAGRAEVEAGFAWHDNNPNDAGGRRVFARKDVLTRILGYIQSKRRQAQPVPMRGCESAGEPAAAARAWAAATEEERESARAVVREAIAAKQFHGMEGSSSFRAACEHVLLTAREKTQTRVQ